MSNTQTNTLHIAYPKHRAYNMQYRIKLFELLNNETDPRGNGVNRANPTPPPLESDYNHTTPQNQSHPNENLTVETINKPKKKRGRPKKTLESQKKNDDGPDLSELYKFPLKARRELFLKHIKKDPLLWFNLFAWTFDPRKEIQHIPFITYPFQDKYIMDVWKHIEDGKDLGTGKTRDMGATWMILGLFVYGWLFHGYQFKAGSRKEELVDRIGDMDTLFERMRYMINKQHKWMLPKGFDKQKHMSHMKIINPEKKNQILGEATTRSFSRAGRYKAILLDEFGFVDDSEVIWRAAGDSSPCLLPLSTPNGLMNKFAKIMHSGSTDVHSLHWTMHPDKAKGAYLVGNKKKVDLKDAYDHWKKDAKSISSPWYEGEKQRRDAVSIAQELDIDYMASAGQAVFDRDVLGDYIRNAKKPLTDKNGFKTYREFDPTAHYVMGVDTSEGLANGDNSAVVFINCKRYSVDAIYQGKPDIEVFARMLKVWGEQYNEALIVIEDNNHGMAVINDLKKIYHNIYYRKLFDESSNKQTKKIGWRTTTRTKPIMIEEVKEALKAFLYIPSVEILNEMMTFVYHDNNKMAAQTGCHDDMVMALACALQGYLESDHLKHSEYIRRLPRYCAERIMSREVERELVGYEEFFA